MMKMIKAIHKAENKKSHSQQGSAFFYILLAVILFATLAYTVSRGMRGSATDSMTERQAELAASDILNIVQTYTRAVDKMRNRGCSENDISFTNNIVSGYAHSPVSVDTCQIFHPNGGKISYQAPLSDWLDNGQSAQTNYGTWFFTGTGQPNNVGTSPALLLILPYMKRSLCLEINDVLGIENNVTDPPQDDSNAYAITPFTGSFSGNNLIYDLTGAQALDGQSSGCFEGGGTPPSESYHFYSVLIER